MVGSVCNRCVRHRDNAIEVPRASLGDIGFNLADVDLAMSAVSARLLERLDLESIRQRRIANSRRLRERLDESVERILLLKSRAEFAPLRYRTHLKARITRQVEKLRHAVVETTARHVTV